MEDPKWQAQGRRVAQMSASDFEQLWIQQDQPTRDSLVRARFRWDRRGFLRFCLPAVFDSPFNPFHSAVLDVCKRHWSEQLVNERRLNLAPRGLGKSTIKKGDVAHSIVYGLRRFIVVICATRPDARDWALTLQDWFRTPTDGTADLHRLFGPFTISGEQQRFTISGPSTSTTVLCASANASVQGANELTHRPDEVILDDWEDRKRVSSEVTRKAWKRKLTGEIAKLGDRRRGMITEANVTISHDDAPSACIRRSEDGFAGWLVHEFPAIYDWPAADAHEMWDRCRRIFLNLALGDPTRRYQLAHRFYELNQARMDDGARVLDSEMLPIFDCYVMIWEEGLTAFLREMQHQANINLDGLFVSADFVRCRVEWDAAGEATIINGTDGRRIPRSDMVRALCRWDWASGVPGGDYAALAVILRDSFGYGYVVDGWMKVAKTSAQVQAAWSLCEKWQIPYLSVETNQGQVIVTDEVWPTSVAVREKAGQWVGVVAHAEPSTKNKEAELSALEPATNGGILQFVEGLLPDGMSQFDAFDGIKNSHKDDFHDAVARGWQRTGGMPPRMGQTRVWG